MLSTPHFSVLICVCATTLLFNRTRSNRNVFPGRTAMMVLIAVTKVENTLGMGLAWPCPPISASCRQRNWKKKTGTLHSGVDRHQNVWVREKENKFYCRRGGVLLGRRKVMARPVHCLGNILTKKTNFFAFPNVLCCRNILRRTLWQSLI